MTGQAEKLRDAQSELPLTALVNGDFESLLDGNMPAGWYYVRQATIETKGPKSGIATLHHIPEQGHRTKLAGAAGHWRRRPAGF